MSDKVKIYCPDCGGSKRIPTEDPKSFSSYPCPTCRGTGEVESRSVQRREACQKGEPMPEFDKPVMPERIWAETREPLAPLCQEGSWLQYAPVEWRINGSIVIPTEYLRADKVRELVRAVDVLRNYAWDCMEGRKQTEKFVKLNCPVESLINALFPEGVSDDK